MVVKAASRVAKERPGYLKLAFGFLFDEELSIYSAALSFNVILSLIPFLMLGFYFVSFFPQFGEFFDKFRSFLFQNIAAVDPKKIEKYLQIFMSNYKKLGLIGLFATLYTNFIFLRMFDTIAQKIFGCGYRNTLSTLSVYSLLFLSLCVAISIPIALLVGIKLIDASISINIFPIQLFISAFLIFKVIPNRHIDTRNAVTASIIATVLIEALRVIFIYYVFYSKAYLTIYGSFATLFLFFLWISVSAQLFLLCMKFCAHLQNSSPTSKTTPKVTSKK